MVILVKVSKESLWGYTAPGDWNEEESYISFQNALATELEQVFPNTEIEVEMIDGFDSYLVDGFAASDEMENRLMNIVATVWSSFGWMIANSP